MDELFLGTYEIRLNKGRPILPKPFLEKLKAESPEKKVFYFVYGGDMLQICSEQGVYDHFAEERKMSGHDQVASLEFISATWSLKGKISIPKKLIQMYRLSNEKKIIMLGVGQRIELYRKDVWKQWEDEVIGEKDDWSLLL